MTWFYLSLLAAFLTATNASLFKIVLRKNDQYVSAWLGFAIATLIFLAMLFRLSPRIENGNFWTLIAILLPLELVAFLSYLKALQISPLSLVFPFLALTPFFTIMTSYIFLKERLVPSGMIGVACIVIGAYLLNAYTIKQGALEPLKRIFEEKGILLMIFASFIYSITSTIGKKAMLYVGPTVFPAIYFPLFFAVLSLVVLYRLKKKSSRIKMDLRSAVLFCAISVLFALMALIHFKAISLTNVSYMISVKRLSLLFAVLYGAVIFKEQHIRYRLLGGATMLVGTVIIVLAQR